MNSTPPPPDRAATIAIAALAAASAQAYSPPRGTPDLAQMMLQSSDLAPGAAPVVNGYSDPGGAGLQHREYDRDWLAGDRNRRREAPATSRRISRSTPRPHSRRPSSDGSRASTAQAPWVADRQRRDAGNGSSATSKDARFSKMRSIGVGQQSIYGSATIATKGSTLAIGSHGFASRRDPRWSPGHQRPEGRPSATR